MDDSLTEKRCSLDDGALPSTRVRRHAARGRKPVAVLDKLTGRTAKLTAFLGALALLLAQIPDVFERARTLACVIIDCSAETRKQAVAADDAPEAPAAAVAERALDDYVADVRNAEGSGQVQRAKLELRKFAKRKLAFGRFEYKTDFGHAIVTKFVDYNAITNTLKFNMKTYYDEKEEKEIVSDINFSVYIDNVTKLDDKGRGQVLSCLYGETKCVDATFITGRCKANCGNLERQIAIADSDLSERFYDFTEALVAVFDYGRSE